MKVYLLAAAAAILSLTATHEAAAQNRRNNNNTTTMPATSPTATTPDNTANPPADTNGKLDYRNPAADPLIPVEAEKRQPITDDLQATVVELLELFHDSKQSHWNLRGPIYLSLHEQLQENADEYRKYGDILAERVLQVGHPIDGRTSVIAATANLGGYPGGYLSDKQVLILMTERINTVAKRVRQRIEHMSKVDEVTSNQLQELSYALDKQVWKFRVMQQ
ncbi:DNA starvation/stationary phase protection protein [Hymenobacter sp. UV11]|uniref:Dps family protein n=1 Tax=Hymenobacter sp. UV11 TaxID=1849735 RepID=UPI00105ED4BF|nr:DNA starvation/stationary phase protection protein [Hymenobacter sp. UV11]TDN38412.1 DNA starvation/stationary phase protection protein [Hymenobacter sp. UV11]TFZ67985.1 DNA starvation/stationary phase protection protein [Hymenobacter sp. UV11]